MYFPVYTGENPFIAWMVERDLLELDSMWQERHVKSIRFVLWALEFQHSRGSDPGSAVGSRE